MKSHTKKNDQEVIRYDKTKRGIVLVIHTEFIMWWKIDAVRAKLHSIMQETAPRYGIGVKPEPDYPVMTGLCGDHDNVVVSYALDDNDADIGQLLDALKVKLYDYLGTSRKLRDYEVIPSDAIVREHTAEDGFVTLAIVSRLLNNQRWEEHRRELEGVSP